jgi:predicted P-loop ATPase
MDSTGGRRFWPVRVIKVQFDRLNDERGPLLAEARNLYREGELWFPKYDGEIEMMIREQQASRVETDPWDQIIAGYVEHQRKLNEDWQPTLGGCFHACGVLPEKQDRMGSRRIGVALRGLGWVKKRAAKNAEGKQEYVWVRDD